jgi:hypothetical protein
VLQLIARGAMNLRNRANAQGVLGTNAMAAGNDFATVEQATQVAAHALHAGVRFERDDFRVEGIELAAQGLEAHGADNVRPLAQTRGVIQRQAAQAGHARGTVDQAQTILGTQLDRRQADLGQGCCAGMIWPR